MLPQRVDPTIRAARAARCPNGVRLRPSWSTRLSRRSLGISVSLTSPRRAALDVIIRACRSRPASSTSTKTAAALGRESASADREE